MPRSSRTNGADDVSVDAAALAAALRGFPSGSAERGRGYARGGRVRSIELARSGTMFIATVRGTRTYQCEWAARRGGGWTHACSCPVATRCKHAYASACCVIAWAIKDGGRIAVHGPVAVPDRLGSITIPPITVRDMASVAPDEHSDDEAFCNDDFGVDEPVPTGGAGITRPVARPDKARDAVVAPRTLASLVASRTAARRDRETRFTPPPPPTLADCLDKLRTSTNVYASGDLARTIADMVAVAGYLVHSWDIAREEDGDIRCLLLAQRIAARMAPRPLPPELQACVSSPVARAKLRQRCEQDLRIQLQAWISPPAQAPTKHLRAVVSLHRHDSGDTRLRLAPLLTSSRLRDDLRRPEQLRSLLEEAAHSRCLSPPSYRLCHWLVTRLYSTFAYSVEELEPEHLEQLVAACGHTGLVTWDADAHPDLCDRAGIRSGDLVRIGSGTARIEPWCLTENGATTLQMQLRLGTGEVLPLRHVVHLRCVDTPWVIVAGTLWRIQDAPPSNVVHLFDLLGSLPVDPVRHLPLLRSLAGKYEGVREVVERHTRRLPVRPIFLLDGEPDDALEVRLLAIPPDVEWSPAQPLSAGATYEYRCDGTWCIAGDERSANVDAWTELAHAAVQQATTDDDAPLAANPSDGSNPLRVEPSTADDAWLTEPDAATTEPAVAWLRRLCPAPSHDPAGWLVRLRRTERDTLLDAWESRPSNATFYATRRIQRLLSDVRPMPSLDIRTSGKDWFAIKLDWQVEGRSLSSAEIAALLASDDAYVRLGDRWMRGAAAKEMRETLAALADAGIDGAAEEQRIGLWQLASAPAHALERLQSLGADAATVAAAKSLRRKVEAFRGLPRAALPRTFTGKLRAYQQDGLDFLAFTSSLGSGAVLADDMGLGKTVQTLAWLERLRLAGKNGPALVVCPASVVHNWREEAQRFAPKMRVAILSSGSERHDLRERAADFDLLITNYALLRRDAESWSDVELGALVLDEAQNVKNPDAGVTRAVRSLSARHRLALTGTPLENRTRDLWSIVEGVSPGYFGTRKRFEERFERRDPDEIDRRLLAARLRPIMLRRRKSEVAPDLPPRTEEVRRCELTTEQRRLYLATLRASRQLVDELKRKGAQGEKARIQILAALTRLRQICCHPGLVDPKLVSADSSKFDLLLEVLEPLLAEGHKVLVFSQFARCIQLLAVELSRRDMRHFVLTGATQKRDVLVSQFQECADPAVFLISLKAGGTGLNLTAASYVVLFDPWWNPAVEAQAIDRTHRIGQSRSVMAYRLVATGTIEEKILELQREKAALADAVIDDESFGRRLGKEDLAYLLAE